MHIAKKKQYFFVVLLLYRTTALGYAETFVTGETKGESYL